MKIIIIFVLLGLTLSFTGCNKDETHTSVIGAWNCEEYSEAGKRIYQVSIVRNYFLPNATDEYIINNFHNMGNTPSTEVYAKEEGEVGKRILKITGTSAIGKSINGTGAIANDFSKIVWNYQVNDGNLNPVVSATYY